MESLGLGEVIGIGGVAVGAFYIINKMWKDHTELSRQVIGVIERDATVKQELKAAIETNTSVTRESRDVLSNLLLESIKNNKQNGTVNH